MLNDVKAMLKRSATPRARNYINIFKQTAAASAADTVSASAVTGAAASRLAAELASGLASGEVRRVPPIRRWCRRRGAHRHAQIVRPRRRRRKIIVNVQPVFHLTYRTDADFVKLRFNSKFAMKSKS